ncbi:hypothetical protein ACLHDG_05130 [Sulfurovum sp. CS9]|uniref:hypothetical protein n=1 Tax=Sulfurovum sp. CS9 TaxID=3391146 RepID=UPI0039EAF715
MSTINNKPVFNNNFNLFFKISILFIITFFFSYFFSVAKADTGNTGNITRESLKVSFKPETKRINVGAEESVALHIENGERTEGFIVTLGSNDPKIILPVTTSLTASGMSLNNIKIKAIKEGIATITATVIRGPPPAKPFDSTEALPSTGRTPTLLPRDERESLEDENGFQKDHANKMHTFAQDKGVFLIVRDGNPDSVDHFSNPSYMPKPMSCKAKTAQVGRHKGLVVDPTNKEQVAEWDKAIDEAKNEAEADRLREKRKKAVDTWNQYGEGMIKKGYRVNKDTGVIEYVQTLPGGKEKVWEGIHGDYDLHGVYRRTGDGTMERISYGSGIETINGQAFRGQLNHWLTGEEPKDFIQHGGQDDWLPDPNIVPVKPSDPPVVVFFPDGRLPERLKTAEEMRYFYEDEMGVLWPYQTKDKDKRDADDSTSWEVKVKLSIKVVNLVKDLEVLFSENSVELLPRPPDIDTPKLPKRYDKDDYADLYMDTAYKIASKALKLSEKELPVEGYALLPSSDVFKTINKDRNFTDELSQKIGEIGFKISTREIWTARDVEQDIDEMEKIRKEIVSKIVKEYKRKEKEIINKAFSKFVSKVVAEYPEMQERLISVQAFYDLYKKKEEDFNQLRTNITTEVEPFLKVLIQAKTFVDGAVLFYKEGPLGFFKILIFKAVQGKCYFMFDYVDDTLVMAGANTAGPVGAFAGYALGKTMAYGVCNIMITAVFDYLTSEGEDSTDLEWVKIFYTGEIVDKELSYDVNFFSRFGWSREEILDKTKNPELLNKALDKHLTNLWKNHPELREFLDVKGEVNGIGWDNNKGKNIWKDIFKTANKDMATEIRKKLENMKVSRGTMDIEKYFINDAEIESVDSWLLGNNNGSMLSKVLVELPKMANEETIPKEFSIGEAINVNMRFFVLGYAGHNETVSIQWVVRRRGWLYGQTIEKKDEDIVIKFPKEKIKEVEEHIKLEEPEFSFTIDEDRFSPGYSYSLEVTLKHSTNTLRWFEFPFTIKLKPTEDENETATDKKDDNDTGETPISPEGNNTKEEECKAAKEKVKGIESDLNTTKNDVHKIDAKIEEIKKKIELIKKKIEAKNHKDEAYRASLEVVEAKQEMEALALRICEKAEKIINTTSGTSEEIDALIKELEDDYRKVRELKNKARKAFKKAEKEAEEAEKIFEEYKSLVEKIEELEKQFEQSNAALESIGQGFEKIRESIGQELTPSSQNVPSKGNETEDCMENVNKIIDSKEKELVGIQDDLKKIMSESSTFEATREQLKKMENAAKDARASADTAEVYYGGLEKLASDAGTCVAAVGKLPMKVYFIISIEGKGPLQKYGAVYVQDGMNEEILVLERAEDLKAALKAKEQALLAGDLCDKLQPSPYPPKYPAIWNNGPIVTRVDGPFVDMSEFSDRKLKDTWKTVDTDGPSLEGLRKSCKENR